MGIFIGFLYLFATTFFTTFAWVTAIEIISAIIKHVLPKKYGKKVSQFVRKVIGIVRKVGNFAELMYNTVEFSGLVSKAETEYIEWSEVPEEIQEEIQRKGQYVYEQSIERS